jgi:hypothetical protein
MLVTDLTRAEFLTKFARCDLDVLEDDEGAGEPVDPDSFVPTVGANYRGSNPAMPMLEGFRSIERLWDPANSTAVDKRRGAHEFYPGSCPLSGGSLHPTSNLVYDIWCLQGAAGGGFVCV